MAKKKAAKAKTTKKKTSSTLATKKKTPSTLATNKKTSSTLTIDEIDEKADSLGIKTDKLPLAQIARDIQLAEGHKACFGRSASDCSETECQFRKHCLEAAVTGNLPEPVEQTQDQEQRADNTETDPDITQDMADVFSMVKTLEVQVETSAKLNEDLNSSVAESQQQLTKEAKTRTKLEKRLKTAEAQATDAESLTKDMAYTQHEREKLSKLLAESHQQLQAMTDDYKRLSNRVEAAQARAKNAAKLEKQVNELQEKLEASDKQVSSLQKKMKKQSREMAAASKTLEEEIAKRRKSEQVMGAVKERLKGLSL